MTGGCTVVHLVRHGEVENPSGVLYGRLPGFGLSGAGREMAAEVARFFDGIEVSLIVSSPLERARQTAEPLATRTGLPVRVDDRLIESANRFQGMRVGTVRELLGRPANLWLLRNPFTPSWGERYDEVARRVLDAAASAARDAAGGHAVLVSHQLPIWVARRRVEGRHLWHRPDRRLCSLGSVTSLHYRGGRVVAVDYREPAGAAARNRAVPGA